MVTRNLSYPEPIEDGEPGCQSTNKDTRNEINGKEKISPNVSTTFNILASPLFNPVPVSESVRLQGDSDLVNSVRRGRTKSVANLITDWG